MKFHDLTFRWLNDGCEFYLIFGMVIGRVGYEPQAKWLYSFRLFAGVFKIELLWTTGNASEAMNRPEL